MSRATDATGCGCTRRAVWTSACIGVLVLAFTAHLLGVLTPSWQYAYLEDGRTEHHHGLWLDCKRDYSNEYGRPREYYESIYRLNHLQNPFDQFWLPHLQCVYKFDYWLDDEDWYEHGYDENRLQGDAYQHLFIGWKIAAFTAHAFALVCELNALIMLFCGFCHRLLICVSTVLVTLADISNLKYLAIACAIGNGIFYMFASYQDNNILREEDGIYEQYFGWSFYSALTGGTVLLGASILGCSATSAVLSTERTRLLKIEVDEDGKQLLHMKSAGGAGYTKNSRAATATRYFDSAATSTTQAPSSGGYDGVGDEMTRFRRSKSAVYKIDSNALRAWERENMRDVTLNTRNSDFKRANSLPNVAKRQARDITSSRQSLAGRQSDVNLSMSGVGPLASFGNNILPTSTTREFIPSRNPLRIMNAGTTTVAAAQIMSGDQSELIYEYVDERSLAPIDDSASSSAAFASLDRCAGWLRPVDAEAKTDIPADITTLNTYDRVPLANVTLDVDKDDYLTPISVSGSDSAASVVGGETTFTVEAMPSDKWRKRDADLAAAEAAQRRIFCDELRQKQQQKEHIQQQNGGFVHEGDLSTNTKHKHRATNTFGINSSAGELKSALRSERQNFSQKPIAPEQPISYLVLQNDRNKRGAKSTEGGCFQINTFQAYETTPTLKNGSLTAGNSLENNSDQASSVSVFDRRDSIDFSAELDAALQSPQPLSLASSSTIGTLTQPFQGANPKQHYFGGYRPSLISQNWQLNVKETNFNGSILRDSKNGTPNLNYYGSSGRTNYSFGDESETDRSISSITTFNRNNNRNNSNINGDSSSPPMIASPWNQKPLISAKSGQTSAIGRTMI